MVVLLCWDLSEQVTDGNFREPVKGEERHLVCTEPKDDIVPINEDCKPQIVINTYIKSPYENISKISNEGLEPLYFNQFTWKLWYVQSKMNVDVVNF